MIRECSQEFLNGFDEYILGYRFTAQLIGEIDFIILVVPRDFHAIANELEIHIRKDAAVAVRVPSVPIIPFIKFMSTPLFKYSYHIFIIHSDGSFLIV